MNLFAVVGRSNNIPVPPLDDNRHDDQGCMVYKSLEAANMQAVHQKEEYEIDAVGVPLSEVNWE